MSPKGAKFHDSERVLCFHGPLLYEAKCMKSELRDKIVYYLIHYNGWNKHWDEWVLEQRVLKYNAANLQRQAELLQQQNKDKSKRSKPAKLMNRDKDKQYSRKSETISSSPAESKRKRVALAVDSDTIDETEEEKEIEEKMEAKIEVPSTLRAILYEDSQNITKKSLLCKLPADKSVEDLLNDFIEHERQEGGYTNHWNEFAFGIKAFFDQILNTRCLYGEERQQYSKLVSENENKSLSKLYGGVHLLRFFIKVGPLLTYTSLYPEHITKVIEHMHKFLSFIESNSSKIFVPDNYILTEN